jgi:gliding motility-associated-like protein
MIRHYLLLLFFAWMFVHVQGQYVVDLDNISLPSRIFLYSSTNEEEISIRGLKPQESYELILISSQGDQISFTSSELIALGSDRYRATGITAVIRPEIGGWQEGYLSISQFVGLNHFSSRMQGIQVSGGATPDQLIRDVLIGGDCFDVENVSPIGSSAGMGTFTADSAAIGLEEGVILATGDISVALGPNDAPNSGVGLGDTGGDPDLSQLTSGSIRDAVGIEFDFTPTSDFVKFRYVFASEEYCEFVGTPFNDVFGFFLSGPGINGPFTNDAVNLATIPGTNTYVAINNVNHNSNSEYFFDNTPIDQPQTQNFSNCNFNQPPSPGVGSVLDIEGVSVELVEYDGFTAVFEAILEVQACETYHIKMVVADVTDGIYDSAVFLEANSFNAGSEAVLDGAILQTGGLEGYEGCNDAYLEVTRLPNSDLSQPLEILLNVNPASTATSGVDLTEIPPSVTIPRNQESVRIPLRLFQDNIIEGDESILIETNFICSCESPFIELIIRDIPEIEVNIDDITVCEEEGGVMTAFISGGLPGSTFSYEWEDGFNTPTRPIPSQLSSNLTVTVTDDCDNSATGEVNVTVIPFARAEIGGDILVCNPGQEVEIPVVLSGQGPYSFSYALNGDQVELISDYNDSIYFIRTVDTGLYTIPFILGQDNCPGETFGEVRVSAPSRNVHISTQDILCHGDTTGRIELDLQGFDGGAQISWLDGRTGDTLTDLRAGRYAFTISDSSGCVYTDTAILSQPDSLVGRIQTIQPPTCGNAIGMIEAVISGGIPEYDITWEGRNDTADILENIGPGKYVLVVSDLNGCNASDSITLENSFPEILLDSIIPATCEHPGYIDIRVINGIEPLSYQWSNGATTEDLSSVEGGRFSISITDTLGCAVSDTFSLDTFLFQPLALAGSDMEIDCSDDPVILDASASRVSSTTNIEWLSINDGSMLDENRLLLEVREIGVFELYLRDTLSGCSSRDTVEVTQVPYLPAVLIDSPDVINCYNPVITLDASNSTSGMGYEYLWTTNSGSIVSSTDSSVVSIDRAGIYTLTVTYLPEMCSASSEVTVHENLMHPSADAGPDRVISCDENEVDLDGTNTSVSGNTFSWNSLTGDPIQNPNTLEPTVSRVGTYILTVQNISSGCQDRDSVDVFPDNDLPLAIIESPDVLTCEQTTVTLDATQSDQGNNISFEWWTGSGNFISGQNTLAPEVDRPGEYALEVMDESNGCESVTFVTVMIDTISPQIGVSPPDILSCENTSIELSGVDLGGNYAYTWTSSSGMILNTGGETVIEVDEDGTYVFNVMDLNNGCESTISVLVNKDIEPPIADAGPDAVLDCRDNPAFLDGSGSSEGGQISYEWINLSSQSVISDSSIANVFEPGEYSLLVTDEVNGCTAADQVVVIQPQIESISYTQEDINCLNSSGSIEITNVIGGIGPYSFTIFDPPETSATGVFSDIPEGTYTVAVEDQLGCVWNEEVSIITQTPVSVTIEGESQLEWGEMAILGILLNKPLDEITSIQWEPIEEIDCGFCPDIQFIPSGPMTVTVEVTDEGGCTDIAQIPLELSLRPEVYIPNAFTPTGDLINDNWYIFTNAAVAEIEEVSVFNRWGDRVFQRTGIPPNDPTHGWDGTFNGKYAQEGVYAYWVSLKLVDGTSVFYKGDVHLLR